jgi:hypothetical protein
MSSRFVFLIMCLLLLFVANVLALSGFQNNISMEGFAARVLGGERGPEHA